MLMFDGYVRYYALCVFLVWLSKLFILSFGGISLYRRTKPCAFGLIVGYVFAAGCSFLLDAKAFGSPWARKRLGTLGARAPGGTWPRERSGVDREPP